MLIREIFEKSGALRPASRVISLEGTLWLTVRAYRGGANLLPCGVTEERDNYGATTFLPARRDRTRNRTMSAYSQGCLSFEFEPSTNELYRTLDFMGLVDERVSTNGNVSSRKHRGRKRGILTDTWRTRKLAPLHKGYSYSGQEDAEAEGVVK